MFPKNGFRVVVQSSRIIPETDASADSFADDKDCHHWIHRANWLLPVTLIMKRSTAGIYAIWPIVLLEAMSYGLPVLVSDIPANKEVELPPER